MRPVLDVDPIYAVLAKAKPAVESGDNQLASQYSDEAWALVPEPRFGWDSSYICTHHTVKILRRAGLYDKAIALVNSYMTSGFHLDYQDGPYFWLGTLHFEIGEMEEAFGLLKRANSMSGGRCFLEEDPKYKKFLKTFKSESRARNA